MVSLKDYNRQIIWLDYFDSSLSRSQGRRVPKNRTIKNPDLSNLIRAAERLDLKPEGQHAKHPNDFLYNLVMFQLKRLDKNLP